MSAQAVEPVAGAGDAFTAGLTTLLHQTRALARTVDRDGLLDLTAAADHAIAMLHAFQLETVAALDDHPVTGIVPGSTDDPTCDELQCELAVSTGIAHQLLDLARTLRTRLPGTHRLLATGAITIWHARRLAERTADLTIEQCAQVEDRVLPKAAERTTPRFTDSIRRALIAIDHRTAEEHRQRHARDRRVTIRPAGPDGDGMSILWALLPDTDAQTCRTALDTHARRTLPGDARTLDQRRADALTDLCQTWLDGSHHPHRTGTCGTAGWYGNPGSPGTADQFDSYGSAGSCGNPGSSGTAGSLGVGDPSGGTGRTGSSDRGDRARRPAGPAIHVTLTLDALLGEDEQAAHLAGSGPITAPAARQLAARPGATFTRYLVHPRTGRLLRLDPVTYRDQADLLAHAYDPVDPPQHSPGCRTGTGGDRYRPTAAQARFVRARDPVCTFPHCRRPASSDDLDHADDHAHSGITCHCGLHPLCRHHHNAKTRRIWRLHHHPDGSITWTSPTGRTHHIPAHDHRDD